MDDPGRRAASLLGATVVARIPITVFSVLFVTQSELEYGHVGVGGTATLLYAVGATVNGLVAGWLLARFGDTRVTAVLSSAAVAILLTGALPFFTGPTWMCVLAGAIGLCYPPLHISSRARYPALVTGRALLRIYSWDVSLIQVSWLAAPVLVVALAGTVGVAPVYAVLAAQTAAGAVWYLATLTRLPARAPSPPTALARGSRALRSPDLPIYLTTAAVMMGVSGLLMPTIVVLSGTSAHESLVILVWSAGSAIGSVVVNRSGIRRHRLIVGAAAALAAAAWVTVHPSLPWLALGLVVLGFATAPVTGAMFYSVSTRYSSSAQGYVFGMITSAQLVAQGIGSTVGGQLIDAGALLALAGVVIAALLVLVGVLAVNPRGSFSPAGGTTTPTDDDPRRSTMEDVSL